MEKYYYTNISWVYCGKSSLSDYISVRLISSMNILRYWYTLHVKYMSLPYIKEINMAFVQNYQFGKTLVL